MFSLLTPDKFVDNYYDITPELIRSLGGKALFVDLDGTLVSKDTPLPTSEVIQWIDSMRSSGFDFVIISNNSDLRVSNFCQPLNIRYISMAKKPLPIALKSAFRFINAKTKHSEVIMVGDQIFTDTLAGKQFGAKSIYVNPIDQSSLYVKLRTRITEKPFTNKAKENK